MITKDRVFIISANVDDSIRSASVYSDISIYKTFKEFEDYVNLNPIDASMIIVNSKDLAFTSSSMTRIVNILNSSFVSLDGFLYYMVDDESIMDRVNELCTKNSYTKFKCIYSPTLHAKDVADVISGESLSSKETVTLIKTYRVRAADYVRMQRDKEELSYAENYVSDEDQLSGIADERIPTDLRATDSDKAVKHVICGNSVRERTAWVALKAQYLCMNGKTLIVERDMEYHTLFDIISKIEIDFEFFDIVDMYRDISDVITRIKSSKSKLIFIGSKNRVNYNYDVLISILMSNLEDNIDHYIYETILTQIPYGTKVDIVLPTTVPEILKSVNEMSSISTFKDIFFIGLDITNLGSVSITETEMTTILEEIFQESKVNLAVVKVRGLLLRKEIGLGGIFMYH